MIENYRPDPKHNPTKLLPRGIHIWYADPYPSRRSRLPDSVELDIQLDLDS